MWMGMSKLSKTDSLVSFQIIVFMCYGIMLNKWVLQTYQPDFMKSPLVYHPGHRAQVWRFFSYMFMHVGYGAPLTTRWFFFCRTGSIKICLVVDAALKRSKYHVPSFESCSLSVLSPQFGAAGVQCFTAADDWRSFGDGPWHLTNKSALHGRSAGRWVPFNILILCKPVVLKDSRHHSLPFFHVQ